MNQIIYAGKHLVTYAVSWHAHTSWELIYCTGGEGVISYEGGTISYHTGELVIIPPLVPHRNESKTGFTNIHLNILQLTVTLRAPTLVKDGDNHFLLDAFSGAFYQFSAHPGKQTSLLEAYSHLIATLIADQLSAPQLSPVVAEIENSILRSYPDESFALDEYLQSLPFSYDYLRKLFQKELGVTPHRFLSETRLRAAAERLGFSESEGVSISEIAHHCGFREPLYFSRMFRKEYGLSPRQYQEKLRTEMQSVPDGDSIKIQVDA